MKHSIVSALLCLGNFLLFCNAQTTVNLRIHVFNSEEYSDMGLSIQEAEYLVQKVQADFDGTTGASKTSNPASHYDTQIRFCPEIVMYYDDDLVREDWGALDAAYSSSSHLDVYINNYGDQQGGNLLKGRKINNDACWVGLNHAKMSSATDDEWTVSHEIGHVLGLLHSCNTCTTEFMIASTANSSTVPYEFSSMDSITMTTNLGMAPWNAMVNSGTCPAYTNASFEVNEKRPATSQTIIFTDRSHSNVTSHNWSFGAGAIPATATGPGPHHVQYATPGNKAVSLTVGSGTDTDTRTEIDYIHVEPASIQVPYMEDFNDPDFLTSDGWYMYDSVPDGLTFMHQTNTHLLNLNFAIGQYYIGAPRTVDYVNADGDIASGALTLEVLNLRDDWYNQDLMVYSPDFNFTGITCGKISFDLCHIPANNGWTQMAPPNGDCNCSGDYLYEPEYAGNSFVPGNYPFGNWDDACSGITAPECVGKRLGYPDCNNLERLSLEWREIGLPWNVLWTGERDELLTVPNETCSSHPFAPISEDWWRCINVDIPSNMMGQKGIQFRFVYHSGEGTNTLLIDNFRLTDKPVPDLQVQNICGNNGSGSITADILGCTGAAPFTYQWFTDCSYGVPINGQTAQVLTVNTPGSYGVIITDANNCSAKGCATVGFVPDPCTPPASTTVCAGECVNLGCPRIPGYSYEWSHDEVRNVTVNGTSYQYTFHVIDGTDSELCVGPVSNTTYTLVMDDNQGCTFTYSFPVTVNTSPTCVPQGGPSCCGEGNPLYTNPCLTFERIIGTPGDDYVGKSNPLHSGAVIQTGDRGYLLSGYTHEVEVGAYADQSIIKLNEEGDYEWARQYGDVNGFSDLMDAIPLNDGNYLFAGILGIAGATTTMHLMKTHPDGQIIWDRVLYGDYFATSRSVFETSNNDILVGGYTNYSGETFYVVRLDQNGNLLWRKNFRSTSNSYLSKVMEVQGGPNNGNLVFVGSTLSGNIDGYVLMTDASGNKIWSGNYGLTGSAEEYFDVLQKDANSMWLAGYSTQGAQSDKKAIISEIPLSGGVPNWTLYVDGPYEDHFSALCRGANGRICAAGQSEKIFGFFQQLHDDMLMGSFLDSGSPLGTGHYLKTFGGPTTDERARDIILVQPDNGFAIFGTRDKDFHLIRTDANGNSFNASAGPCDIPLPQTFTTSLSPNFNFTDLTSSHTDEVSPPITGFVMYSNQAIAVNATWDETAKCSYDCGSLKQSQGGHPKSGELSAPQFQVFPNPGQGSITVQYSTESDQQVKIEVTDVHGKSIQRKSFSHWEGACQLDLREQSDGVYFIKVTQQGYAPQSKVFVKQN